MAAEKDLYALLGVAKTASADEIRKAYRKLARKHHPDVNPGNKEAEERFKEISAANDVLSNGDKRKLYDEFGEAGLREGFDPAKARAYQQWSSGRQATGQPFEHEVMDFDLGDMLGDFFSRGGRGQGVAPGRDIATAVEIDFVDSLRGTEVAFQLPTEAACEQCHGSGSRSGSSPAICGDCHGAGTVQAVKGPMRLRTKCPACHGTGKRGTPCTACGGSGRAQRAEILKVRIPPGADNGTKLRVAGRGEPGRGGGPAGDLVLETRIRPHPYFRRDGLDVHLRLPVTLEEAYRGATIEIPTPSGNVNLRVPAQSQQGSKLRLRGKGVTRSRETGDLYVELDVRMPDRDDPKVAEAVHMASQAYSKDVRQEVKL